MTRKSLFYFFLSHFFRSYRVKTNEATGNFALTSHF